MHRIDRWSAGALLIAALVVMPIIAVFVLAWAPDENIWPHLIATVLPRYLTNTAILVVGVGLLAGAVGTGAAWLVTMYEFPGARWLSWALLLPLGIPAYVGAYALVDFLEYAGPVQTWMRAAMGWQDARDYWFPDIRSRAVGNSCAQRSTLLAYVYLLVRAALREQSASAFDVARALGAGPFARFFRIGLPLARPAIAASVAIVMMETISDFGVVSYFSVQTLTTGIFATWLDGGSAGGAAQIASLILVVVFVLVALEKRSRYRLRFFQSPRQASPTQRTRLHGWQSRLATGLCLLPFAAGFVLPCAVILGHAFENAAAWLDPTLARALANTLLTGGSAAIITVLGALMLTYGVRLSGNKLPAIVLPVTTIGYAAPGAVLGVGLLWPMSQADHFIADAVQAWTGRDIGLVMTGSAFAIIYAYCVRFFAIAQGTADAALGRIPPSLTLVARALGKNRAQVLGTIIVPLIRGSIGTALVLVFVDCVKELPATLLLRPFNFNTLSKRIYEKACRLSRSAAASASVQNILESGCRPGLPVQPCRLRQRAVNDYIAITAYSSAGRARKPLP